MSDEKPILRVYRTYVRATFPPEPMYKNGPNTDQRGAFHLVRAATKRDATPRAIRDAEEGKVSFYKAPPKTAVYTVDAGSIRLAVDETVLDHWLAGTDPAKLDTVFNAGKTKSRQGTYFGYHMRREEALAPKGTPRFSYDAKGFLYSYEMPIALRMTHKGKTFVLVNGDGAPSPATNKFMRQMRDRLSKWGWDKPNQPPETLVPHGFVPFSVLEQARIRPEEVRVLATTPDKIQRRKVRTKRNEKGWRWSWSHTLGECLFEARGKVFVCGLDRNDSPSKRMFYMCQIPVPKDPKKWPKTVDAALERLRPEGLPQRAKRQGEWFFVPKPRYQPDPEDPKTLQGNRVPIVSEEPEDQASFFRDGQWDPSGVDPSRRNRHVASSLVVNGAVYAKGLITDAEHTALRLGSVWHKVVKNNAIEGWRYVPTGPTRGARVD